MIETDKGLLKDPVCGMTVTTRSPQATVHEVAAAYFCSAGCKTKFLADPAKYSVSADSVQKPLAPTLKPAASDIIYTCPMHPQIRQVGRGSCPICVVAREERLARLSDHGQQVRPVPNALEEQTV